ncbi:MAG TPA: hypothetical protein VGR28_05210 [Candidatus Thermoplasmatota archaeon]|jgi:hypothetical protein|nr:hypothetical protein [Candidatus Thermoplasmatota archaeon]
MDPGPPTAAGDGRLQHLSHDMRSALAVATAHLDLALERVERGEPVGAEDLAQVERGLMKLNAKLMELDRLAKGAMP